MFHVRACFADLAEMHPEQVEYPALLCSNSLDVPSPPEQRTVSAVKVDRHLA